MSRGATGDVNDEDEDASRGATGDVNDEDEKDENGDVGEREGEEKKEEGNEDQKEGEREGDARYQNKVGRTRTRTRTKMRMGTRKIVKLQRGERKWLFFVDEIRGFGTRNASFPFWYDYGTHGSFVP